MAVITYLVDIIDQSITPLGHTVKAWIILWQSFLSARRTFKLTIEFWVWYNLQSQKYVAESNLTYAQGVDKGVLRVRRLRMHAVLILRLCFSKKKLRGPFWILQKADKHCTYSFTERCWFLSMIVHIEFTILKIDFFD